MTKKKSKSRRVAKNLGNVPDRWRYDGGKLYMLFREGGCSYLVIEKALINECTEDSKIGVACDGREFVLWMDNYSSKLAS